MQGALHPKHRQHQDDIIYSVFSFGHPELNLLPGTFSHLKLYNKGDLWIHPP